MSNTPKHIAIIMDGNGRWAKKRFLPRLIGHRAGMKSVKRIVKAAREQGVEYLTLYAFSTENWKRPKPEVKGLFKLLEEFIDREIAELEEEGVRFLTIGDIAALPQEAQDKIEYAKNKTQHNTKLNLIIALNYGSRSEITRAVKSLAGQVKKGKLKIDNINEEKISKELYTARIPDPDILIRTSGRYRISNFLLWQLSYSELYITRKLWPDFNEGDLKKVINEYKERERTYGG